MTRGQLAVDVLLIAREINRVWHTGEEYETLLERNVTVAGMIHALADTLGLPPQEAQEYPLMEPRL